MKYKEIEIGGKKYVEVCRVDKFSEKQGMQIEFAEDVDMQLALFKVDGNYYCLSGICPHRHQAQIYNGIISGLEISCPLHGWTYSLVTGENINARQGLKSLKKYDVKIINNMIYVEKPALELPKWREMPIETY